MARKPEFSRTEIIIPDAATVELRLHEGIEEQGYFRWKMPLSVATLIAHWWKYREDHSEKEKRFTNLVISMPSSGLVDVYELDTFGHIKPSGWSLPVIVVEALAKELP